MAQGHMVPMVDIGRILAHRGVTVSIITTPLNADRFRPVIDRATQANLKIQLVEFQLPLAQVGLPEGCESFDKLPSYDQVAKLYAALHMLQHPFENFLRQTSPPPSCIISDSFLPWTTGVAQKFGLPRIIFHGPGCFVLLIKHIESQTNILDGIESASQHFVLPGLPDPIRFTRLQITGTSGQRKVSKEKVQLQDEAEKGAFGIVVNSFRELEPAYAQELTKAKGKKVWCIGPVSLSNKSDLDKAERGNKAAIDENECLKWLDSREPGSVVYVCLGSLNRASAQAAIELGLGLESTNKPFVWIVRDKPEELERWFSEEGFEERVKDRGLIVHGWAPQVMILSHPAMGGFVTHCGWNSTLEAVSAGVPMITWPHFADQFLNEKFVVEVLKIGVKIGVEVPVPLGAQDETGVLVTKEDVKTAVECLLGEGEEDEKRRRRAREFAEMANRATDEGGSSYLNVTSLIEDVAQYLASNHKHLTQV